MKEPKMIVPKELMVQIAIELAEVQFLEIGVEEEIIEEAKKKAISGIIKEMSNMHHVNVVRRNVTKENWYHYLGIVSHFKFDDGLKFYFTHEHGIWKLYHIFSKYPEGTFVERWFWNEKEEKLEGECYSLSNVEFNETFDAMFGF